MPLFSNKTRCYGDVKKYVVLYACKWYAELKLNLVHTCGKNRELSPSSVCECILNKLKYEANIRLLLQRYRFHSITSARRSHSQFLRQVSPGFKLVTYQRNYDMFYAATSFYNRDFKIPWIQLKKAYLTIHEDTDNGLRARSNTTEHYERLNANYSLPKIRSQHKIMVFLLCSLLCIYTFMLTVYWCLTNLHIPMSILLTVVSKTTTEILVFCHKIFVSSKQIKNGSVQTNYAMLNLIDNF